MINVSLHRAVVAIAALVITCVLYVWQGSLAAQELPVRLSSLERYRPSAEQAWGQFRSDTQFDDQLLHGSHPLLLEKLKEIPGVKCNIPKGAFYIFPDVSYYFGKKDGEKTIENANDLCMYLLNKAHVALVSGAAFGNPECIRISYAASDDKLIEAAKRMKEKLAQLK